MAIGGRWKERGETLVPVLLAGVALMLDLADDGESFLHAAAVAMLAVAGALSGAAAVVSLGRYGPSRLGRRFALWRACGLFAAAGCFVLGVAERIATPRLVADGTVQLTVLGGAWAALTGWVWGRRSWERTSGSLGQAGDGGGVTAGRGARVG
jgi:hypothetical protein